MTDNPEKLWRKKTNPVIKALRGIKKGFGLFLFWLTFKKKGM